MEEYTCIECENLYDDRDGDTDERMCNKCLNMKNEKYQKVKVPHIHRRGYIIMEKTGEPTTADEHNEKWLDEKEAKS